MEYIKIYFGIFGYLFIIAIVLFIELGKVKRQLPINKKYSVDKFMQSFLRIMKKMLLSTL